MKLNKKECRKFAEPGLKMQLNNGLLHASQVEYIVRTAVRVIDRHKILILYIYQREKAAQGDVRPCMAVFQGRDDFATLARNEDGSTVWRTAAFERLDNDWSFCNKSAFYSPKDEVRVRRYFKTDKSGFDTLTSAQDTILAKRRMNRQRSKEKRIVNRMAGVPALPRGLKGWIHKSVMPAYFFYDYKKGGKDVPGICSACGKEVVLSNVKQGNKAVCPLCKHELVMKPRSRRGSSMYDRDTCQIIQRTSDNELVIRIIKVYYSYQGDIPDVQVYENARQFIYKSPDGRICAEAYYYSYKNGVLLTHWKQGERPKFSQWQECFEADTCGHVYTKNLPDALAGTPWQYCPIAEFYNYWQEPMESLPFLFAYLNHPRLEHLVKTRFIFLVFYIVYRYDSKCLDETQHRTHRILGVAAEDVDFLRGINPDMETLKIYQGYAGMKGRRDLIVWQIENKVSRDVLPVLEHMTPHKATRYLDSQYGFLRLRKTPYGAQRYQNMQALVSEYRDYLEICEKLNYNLKNSFVLYPKDLQKAHDKALCRLKHKADAKKKQDFAAVYKSIAGRFDFEKDGMKIVYPAVPDDVISEGHALHHCVGEYTSRVAEHECIILFLRQCDDETKAFYTIEIRGNKPVQVRGMKNCSPTPEVDKFIKAWEQKVLKTLPAAVA